MTKPIVRDPIYRRRRFDAEIIELCVRWYITYSARRFKRPLMHQFRFRSCAHSENHYLPSANSDRDGIEKENVAPGPSWALAHRRPLWFSMIERLIERPMPIP
jgi:hypothetical protein